MEELRSKVENFNAWVSAMENLNINPYSKGLNVDKMLQDLKEFGQELLLSLKEDAKEEVETPEKAELTGVEQK